MNLYTISGLGADQRVFQSLSLDGNLMPLEWIEPLTRERIEDYAIRLSEKIGPTEEFGIIGVSFGGLIAVEISKILSPKLTVLISSAETKHQLRPIYHLIGKTGILRILPKGLFDPPRRLANWMFDTKETGLLGAILDDTDLAFTKWAINTLTTWDNTTLLSNRVLKIGSPTDKLIPARDDGRTVLIEGGGHFMVVDQGEQISAIINQTIESL